MCLQQSRNVTCNLPNIFYTNLIIITHGSYYVVVRGNVLFQQIQRGKSQEKEVLTEKYIMGCGPNNCVNLLPIS